MFAPTLTRRQTMKTLTQTEVNALAGNLFGVLASLTQPAPEPKRARVTVNVRIEEYQFNHGAKPRGKGTWAFQLEGLEEPVWFKGTFSQAKAEAVKFARELARAAGARVVDVVVLP